MTAPVVVNFVPESPQCMHASLRLICTQSLDPEATESVDCRLEYQDDQFSLERVFDIEARVLERFSHSLKRLAGGEIDTAALSVSGVVVTIHSEFGDPDDCVVDVRISSRHMPHTLTLIGEFGMGRPELFATCRRFHLFLRELARVNGNPTEGVCDGGE